MDHTLTLPAEPDSVRIVRNAVRRYLAGHPRRDDAVLIADELATNAVIHTPTDEFRFRISTDATHLITLSVTDHGAVPWQLTEVSSVDAVATHGRGLYIVFCLADEIGHDHTPDGSTVWAELSPEPSANSLAGRR